MKIESIFQVKGRGTVAVCVPLTCPHVGSLLRHADGRTWLITSIEQSGKWYAGDYTGLLIRPAAEGQAEPVEGDEVEMVEPLTLATLLAEAEHNVRTLREECARLTAPTRGSLINALASAGAARVSAESAFERARTDAARSTRGRQAEAYYDADQRLREARETETAARAALDAFERADREADPCPGSRGF